ncbi:immunoglobulin-like domain-containing protein [Enterococcus rivorum]|nr:immunoglobulin-like domain-containing protein [Enterococcus rivorum]
MSSTLSVPVQVLATESTQASEEKATTDSEGNSENTADLSGDQTLNTTPATTENSTQESESTAEEAQSEPVNSESRVADSVNPYRLGDTTIKGTTDYSVTKYVRYRLYASASSSTVLSTVTAAVNTDGTFSIPINPALVTSTSMVLYVDGSGTNTFVFETLNNAVQILAATAGTVVTSTYNIGNANVTGAVTGDVTQVALKVNGTLQPKVAVSGTNFSISVSSLNITTKDTVSVVGYDSTGKQLDEKSVVLYQGETINPYRLGDTVITGKINSNTTTKFVRSRYYATGTGASTNSASVAVNADGTFSIPISSTLITALTPGVLYVDGSTTNTFVTQTFNDKVTLLAATAGTITPDAYTFGTPNITGKFTGDVAQVALSVDGVTQPKVSVTGGTFTLPVGGLITSSNANVSVIAYDSTGKQLATASIAIKENATADPYYLGDAVLTGHVGTTGAKVVSVYVNGSGVAQDVPVNADGSFSVNVAGKITKLTDTVQVSGQLLVSGTTAFTNLRVPVLAVPASFTKVDDYDLAKATTVTGTWVGSNVAKSGVIVNGTLLGTNPTSGGNFSYYTKGKISKPTDEVYAVLYDASGTELARKQVNITDSNTGTVLPSSYTLGGASITGTYTGAVAQVALKVNGVEGQKSNVSSSDQTFNVLVNNAITNISDQASIVAYDEAGKKLDEQQVTIVEPLVGTLTVNEYTIGNPDITGTATGDITKVAVSINGKLQSKISVNATDNTFKCSVAGLITDPTDIVKVIGYDSNDQQVSEINVTVNEQSTLDVASYQIGAQYVTGFVTGNIATVGLEVNGVEKETVGIDKTRTFNLTGKGVINSKTDTVSVVGYDSEGNKLVEESVTLTDPIVTASFTQVDDYDLSKATTVTGTWTGSNVVKSGLIVNDTLVGTNATSGGKFSYYAKGKITKITDVVYAVLYDANGTEVARQQVNVTDSSTGTVLPSSYTLGGASITGTYTGAVTQVALKVNGVEGQKSNVNSSGQTFNVLVNNAITSVSDQASVVAYDVAGKKLDEQQVTIVNSAEQGPFTSLDDYDVAKSTAVTGKWTGANVAKSGLIVNGTLLGTNTTAGGNFSYYAKGKITKTTDVVYAVLYDANGAELQRKQVKVINSAAPVETASFTTVDDYNILKSTTVTGKWTGANVAKSGLIVNGTLLGTVPASGGNFSYYAKGKITKTTDVVYAVLYDANGAELARQQVNVISSAKSF